MIIGHAIISLLGVVWLAEAFGVPKAIEVGFTPFLWASLLKIILGIACLPLVWKLIGPRSVARRVQ
jgi:biotin transporter BioY